MTLHVIKCHFLRIWVVGTSRGPQVIGFRHFSPSMQTLLNKRVSENWDAPSVRSSSTGAARMASQLHSLLPGLTEACRL